MSAPPVDRSTPELSVIVPLIDDHGMAEACLDSWNAQAARDRMQLVVVDHGIARERAARLAARLRDGDRWIACPDPIESVLYDAGARAADAPLLLLSEAHCVARRGAVETVTETFADPDLAAAVGGSGHLDTGHPLGRMQSALEEEWEARWPAGHFRTISLRGFAIRRATYVEAGGFQRSHARFCETALGITLVRSGKRIGRTAPFIDHWNCTRVTHLGASLSACASGQLAWREEADAATPDAGNEWLGEVGVWSRRDLFDRATARSMLTTIAGSLVAGGWSAMGVRKARGTLRKVPWLAAAALPGGVGLRMVGQARFAIAAGWWWVARASRLGQRAAYRALWSAAFERGFCEFVSRRALLPAWEDVTAESRPLAAFSPGAMAGVHAAGRDGRATGTVVLLRLRFPAGDHSLRLAWRLPVPAAATAVSVFFNGRRVPATAVDADEHSLVVRLERMRCRDDGRQELSLTLCGFPSGAEGRLLGATLQAVSIHPLQMG